MENSLVTTLVITAIGMSLLFLSLVLFYGIISLLTAVTGERAAAPTGSTGGTTESRRQLEAGALQAAAIAIALARAEAEEGTGSPVLPASDEVGATSWWSLHHGDRLAQAGRPRRLGQ